MKTEAKAPSGLSLNADQLYQVICDNQIEAVLVRGNSNNGIVGIQYYMGQETDCGQYCYLCTAQALTERPITDPRSVLIILGEPPLEHISSGSAIITVPESENPFTLLNMLTHEFIRYANLAKRLNAVIINNGGLADIARIALEHFDNPVFIHDEYYNILACPLIVEGVTDFTYNERTRHYMQSVESINTFKISPAYRKTLTTRGGQIYDSDYAPDRIAIYANIWFDDVYKGRLVIPCAFNPPKPRQLFEATYFAEMIRCVMLRRFVDAGDENPLRSFIIDAIDGADVDKTLLEERIVSHDWQPDDLYLCAVISFYSEAVTQLSVFAMCNYIEEHIPGSWVCYYKNAIYLILNCTKGNIGPTELRSLMSKIILESMLNMGVSNVFQNIALFPRYIKQARIALEYGQKKPAPIWYNEFRDCVLEYWLTHGFGELDKEIMCSSALSILRRYDEKHATNLYQTLKTYLYYERNSTVTSKLLKLHRSTLPYRLERIAQLTKVNLDDYNTRLYLNMSFAIMDEN